MPRPLFVVPLTLALLAGLAPGKAVAGPPEAVSGRMVFVDKVAERLSRYRQEKDPEKPIGWPRKLAPSRDLRVAVALGELLEEEDDYDLKAADLLARATATRHTRVPRPPKPTGINPWALRAAAGPIGRMRAGKASGGPAPGCDGPATGGALGGQLYAIVRSGG